MHSASLSCARCFPAISLFCACCFSARFPFPVCFFLRFSFSLPLFSAFLSRAAVSPVILRRTEYRSLPGQKKSNCRTGHFGRFGRIGHFGHMGPSDTSDAQTRNRSGKPRSAPGSERSAKRKHRMQAHPSESKRKNGREISDFPGRFPWHIKEYEMGLRLCLFRRDRPCRRSVRLIFRGQNPPYDLFRGQVAP